MQSNVLALIIALGLVGCASEDGPGANASEPSAVASTADAGSGTSTAGTGGIAGEKAPIPGVLAGPSWPALKDGYRRFESTNIKNIEPSADHTYCQFVMPPVDEDMNVLDVLGAQTLGGHHLTVYGVDAAKMNLPIGEFFRCEPTQGHTELGTWLGSAKVFAPEGAAFRLKKGQGLLLNTHVINTTQKPVDALAYFDIKMEPASANPNQAIAAIFPAVNTAINVPAHQEGDSSVDCVLGEDMDFVLAGNHMHEWGKSAVTSIVRAGTEEPIVLRNDPTWSPESQLNPEFTRWSVREPFKVHAGDIMRTQCSWHNDTDQPLTFPKEMCISTAFMMLPAGSTGAPGQCQAGRWVPSP